MATTINSYSVGLTLDASEYIRKSELSRGETQRLRRAIEEARDPAEKLTLQQERLSKAFAKGAIDAATYNRLLESAKSKHDAAAKAARTHETAAAGIATRIKSLAAAYLGLQTITKSIKLAIDFEQAQARFDVLTGSVENSRVLMGDLKQLSDATPLTFGGVQQAASTMLSFNVPLQDVMRNLKFLGDVSGGNEERFKMMTLAFSQMNAAGRLMGQDLLQMINAGFNPLQQIAAKTGETMAELKKRMEAGGISSAEVTQAFVDATSEGGRFNGMMDRLADTMGGRLAIAMASLEKEGIKLGQTFEPLLTQLTTGVDEGITVIGSLIYIVEKLNNGLAFTIAYWKDIAQIAQGDFSLQATTKLLDDLDKRDRERAADAEERRKGAIDKAAADEAAAANAVARPTDPGVEAGVKAFEKQIEQLKRKNIELQYGEQILQRYELLNDGLNMNQIVQIEQLQEKNRLLEEEQKKREKTIKDEEKRKELLRKTAEEMRKAFETNVTNAIDAARKYFENERKKAEAIRSEISKGIGGDFEVGSQEAQQFFADQANAAIGSAAMPEVKEPTEQEILDEARKQFIETQRQTEIQKRQEVLLQRMLEKFEPTGRIR